MNEPKKRGRPSNAEKAVREAAWQVEEMKTDAQVIRETVWLNPETHSPLQSAQAYAERVWSKQSPDLSRHERLGRVREALEAQGLSMEGVVL